MPSSVCALLLDRLSLSQAGLESASLILPVALGVQHTMLVFGAVTPRCLQNVSVLAALHQDMLVWHMKRWLDHQR